MKVYVFNTDFLTDWSDGLGVIFADTREDAIMKMAKLVSIYPHNIPSTIRKFRKLDIDEYELDSFPGVYIHGGA